MEIRRDMEIYFALDYPGITIKNGKSIRNIQACQSIVKTRHIGLQNHADFRGTFREHGTASPYAFNCTKHACHGHKLDRSSMADARRWLETANIKSVT